jgi:hypothetical protein
MALEESDSNPKQNSEWLLTLIIASCKSVLSLSNTVKNLSQTFDADLLN